MFKKLLAISILATMTSMSLMAAERWDWESNPSKWYGGYSKQDIKKIYPESNREVASDKKYISLNEKEIWRHHTAERTENIK